MTMFCGLLVVAFPITILSINMSELYEEQKNANEGNVTKIATISPVDKLRLKVSGVAEDSLIKKKMSNKLRQIQEDLLKSDKIGSDILNSLETLSAQHEHINIGIQGLLGRVLDRDRKTVLASSEIKAEPNLKSGE
eukprot:NODE_85_length_22232_cov_1.318619.p23 type:complete len:136 gc:universal NODE_85_length_22232_cov_1.318619:16032-15625(-)